MGPSSAMAAGRRGRRVRRSGLRLRGACLVALIRIAYAWIAPAEKPGLRFSEAEIAFLFPAPITRKALIHFRLLSSQLAILFTSALIAVFFNRSATSAAAA
jgi:ABC-2 type transport system permease protein